MAVEQPQWFALWTHSHCEQAVHDQLIAKGFRTFLPFIRDWSQRAGVRRLIPVPMFPSYLFIHVAMDKRAYLEIVKTKGLVRILGERWDALAAITSDEIEAIERVVSSDLSLMPHPYLREGQRVRIMDGPLCDVEGILVKSKPSRGLLVLSVSLLQRSVAVEVDFSVVVPAEFCSRAVPVRETPRATCAAGR